MIRLLFLAAPSAEAFDHDAAYNLRRCFLNNCPTGCSERSK
jgi:hypothetical protein